MSSSSSAVLRLRLLSWHGTSEPRLTASCSSNTGDTAAVLLQPAAAAVAVVASVLAAVPILGSVRESRSEMMLGWFSSASSSSPSAPRLPLLWLSAVSSSLLPSSLSLLLLSGLHSRSPGLPTPAGT